MSDQGVADSAEANLPFVYICRKKTLPLRFKLSPPRCPHVQDHADNDLGVSCLFACVQQSKEEGDLR